jgi:RNA recognition motif-containing protein
MELLSNPFVVSAIAFSSLAWFIVGLYAGKYDWTKISLTKSKNGKIRGKGGKIELYVGNLSYNIRTKELRSIFEKYGEVKSARIISNKFNGKSKGFGFVEMADKAGAKAAINAMSGTEIKGRKLVVNEARERVHD